eukprot:352800-Chlamydomonas_euryale.AAC.9
MAQQTDHSQRPTARSHVGHMEGAYQRSCCWQATSGWKGGREMEYIVSVPSCNVSLSPGARS